MQIIFEPDTKADLDFFIKAGNKSILKKITNLIEAIIENPFEGFGKA
jgi:toxin YoeB